MSKLTHTREMPKIRLILLLSVVIAVVGCRQHDYLEDALRLAGENRVELETVLNHYRQHPADSLKYHAACFLIENMSIHYYYKETPELYDIMDSLNRSDLATKDVYAQFDSIKRDIPVSSPAIFGDLQTLSSEFLIRHIDQSVENWESVPWEDRIDFRDFCEYVLPYIVTNEKRELWIDYYRTKYFPYISDYLRQDSSSIDLKNLGEFLNDSLIASAKLSLIFQGLGNYPPLWVDHIRSGTCDNYVARCIYLMRSLGIPVGRDFAPQWTSYHLPHSWNTLLAEDGKHYPFQGFESTIRGGLTFSTFECPKIFRTTFSIQENSVAAQCPEELHPGFLNSANIKDVTSEYLPVSDVKLKIKKPSGIHSKAVYLYTFNNTTWIPMHGGKIKGGKVTFTDMGRKVVYLPAFYTGKTFLPAGDPFFLDSLGQIISLKPQAEKERLVVERKWHLQRVNDYPVRMLNGRFQGANKPDFSDSEILYTIEQLPRLTFNTVNLNNEHSYRYIRYVAQPGNYANVAELEFYTKEEDRYKKLSGKVIGTNGSVYNMANRQKEVAFDGDVLTFFSHADSGAWVGLDLGEKERIDRIRYLPRNDDNNILPGDLYELFYWGDGNWQSLGQQTGTDTPYLIYDNCPVGALFLLRNHTRGKEERIFTYENGKQIWW